MSLEPLIDGVKVQLLIESPTGPVFLHLFGVAERIQALARVQVGHRTGRLSESIVKRFSVEPGRGPVVEVGSAEPIAYLHHEGTEPHPILPVRARVLAFNWPKAGGMVFLRRVNHPGTHANRYLLDPMVEVLATVRPAGPA